MSKIVYVQRPEGIEPPQRVWVREPEQSVPHPDEPGDYRVEATHPLFPLTTEAQVQAWIRERFHAGLWEALGRGNERRERTDQAPAVALGLLNACVPRVRAG